MLNIHERHKNLEMTQNRHFIDLTTPDWPKPRSNGRLPIIYLFQRYTAVSHLHKRKRTLIDGK